MGKIFEVEVIRCIKVLKFEIMLYMCVIIRSLVFFMYRVWRWCNRKLDKRERKVFVMEGFVCFGMEFRIYFVGIGKWYGYICMLGRLFRLSMEGEGKVEYSRIV